MSIRHLALAAAVLASTVALAAAASEGRHRDGDHQGGHRREEGEHRGGGRDAAAATSIDPTYAKECGACHLAYPPRLLPAASWRETMAGLDRHFGQNAELDEEVRARLEGWLVVRAGETPPGAGRPPPRITGLPWFRHEHHEVPAAAVALPAVRSMANCAACHPGAERWDFDEDRARIPRG